MSIQESYDTKTKTDKFEGKTNIKRKLISIPKVVMFLNLFKHQKQHCILEADFLQWIKNQNHFY